MFKKKYWVDHTQKEGCRPKCEDLMVFYGLLHISSVNTLSLENVAALSSSEKLTSARFGLWCPSSSVTAIPEQSSVHGKEADYGANNLLAARALCPS